MVYTVKIVDYIEFNALAIIYSYTIGQVHLLVFYCIKLTSLSVCPSVSRDNLGSFCMDQLESWFVHS